MARLIMLIGLPGSGKSTYAKSLLDPEGKIKYCSSDSIRKELYGDENIQGNPQTVFEHLHNNVQMYLNQGYDVIYDATNVTRKNRRGVINKFSNIADIEAHVVWAPYEECVDRDKQRVKTVGEDVIRKFLYRWQSPNYDEGFKFIDVVYNCNAGWDRVHYRNCMIDNMNISHDNPHHTLNIRDHCVKAENYILNKWPSSSILQDAGVYHDIGKPFTKGYKTDKKTRKMDTCTAHYYQHDNVGGYLVYGLYSDTAESKQKAIITSWLVCNHMQPFFKSKYYNNLTGSYKDYLDMLHEADIFAH